MNEWNDYLHTCSLELLTRLKEKKESLLDILRSKTSTLTSDIKSHDTHSGFTGLDHATLTSRITIEEKETLEKKFKKLNWDHNNYHTDNIKFWQTTHNKNKSTRFEHETNVPTHSHFDKTLRTEGSHPGWSRPFHTSWPYNTSRHYQTPHAPGPDVIINSKYRKTGSTTNDHKHKPFTLPPPSTVNSLSIRKEITLRSSPNRVLSTRVHHRSIPPALPVSSLANHSYVSPDTIPSTLSSLPFNSSASAQGHKPVSLPSDPAMCTPGHLEPTHHSPALDSHYATAPSPVVHSCDDFTSIPLFGLTSDHPASILAHNSYIIASLESAGARELTSLHLPLTVFSVPTSAVVSFPDNTSLIPARGYHKRSTSSSSSISSVSDDSLYTIYNTL